MQPWVEKYRPKTLKDVVFQEEVVNVLKKSLDNCSLPHLLFYGPPGTGKTSTIRAISNQLFGKELRKDRTIELNASDERGIDVIRNKVKKYAQVAVGRKPSGYKYPCPPFKIVVLDEADSMTKDAQAALRRTMERYSRVTRFCLICNYVSKIIEPVTSRCAKFRFKPLDGEHTVRHLEHLCSKENVSVSPAVLQRIYHMCEGDLRKGITMLQSAVKMFGNALQEHHIEEVSGFLPFHKIHAIFQNCQNGRLQDVEFVARKFIREGYCSKQILNQVHDVLMIPNEVMLQKIKEHEEERGGGNNNNNNNNNTTTTTTALLDDVQKSLILWKLAKSEKALYDGADEYLQLLDVFAFIHQKFSEKKMEDEE